MVRKIREGKLSGWCWNHRVLGQSIVKAGFSGQRIIVRGDRRIGSEKREDRIGGVNGGFCFFVYTL